MRSNQLGRVAAALAALSLAVPVPAQAQFGSMFSRKQPENTDAKEGCGKNEKRSTGSRLLGGVVGSIAGSTVGRTGIGRFLPVAEFADQLTGAIACLLDPEEQKQAADATLEATRGGEDGEVEVGSSASWTSTTREDVSGTSTVTALAAADGGSECITVTDVVIVKGEETTADKRMCRPPGSRRYSLVA
ncbi:hypothetical protein J4558_10360 [Leptolyngbya sp. 15MV]|nr:hypothetical protein J4558_10360 [Leptolyngbya sp. 15MV]